MNGMDRYLTEDVFGKDLSQYRGNDYFGTYQAPRSSTSPVDTQGSALDMRTGQSSAPRVDPLQSGADQAMLQPSAQLSSSVGQPSGNAQAADSAGSAMMASGNPYAMAAGAALKVLSASSAKKAAKKAADAQATIQGTNAMAQSIMNTPVVG